MKKKNLWNLILPLFLILPFKEGHCKEPFSVNAKIQGVNNFYDPSTGGSPGIGPHLQPSLEINYNPLGFGVYVWTSKDCGNNPKRRFDNLDVGLSYQKEVTFGKEYIFFGEFSLNRSFWSGGGGPWGKLITGFENNDFFINYSLLFGLGNLKGSSQYVGLGLNGISILKDISLTPSLTFGYNKVFPNGGENYCLPVVIDFELGKNFGDNFGLTGIMKMIFSEDKKPRYQIGAGLTMHQ